MSIVKVRSRVVAGELTEPGIDANAPEVEGKQRRVQLAPGIAAVLPEVWVVPDHDGVTVRMILDLMDEGVRPTSVTVTSRASGEPITGQSLRAVRVGEIFQEAVGNIIQVADGERGSRSLPLDPVAYSPVRGTDTADDHTQNAARRAGASNDEFLGRVAAVFEAATVSGIPPQRFVMDVFGVARSTAGYWISQARKRGLLAPPGGSDVA